MMICLPVAGAQESGDLFGSDYRANKILVVKVISANLIVLEDGRHVRLISVESYGSPVRKYPKLDKTGRVIEEPVEPFIPLEEQALVFAQDLMENKKVKLEYDVNALDKQGNTLAFVLLPDGRNASIELLRLGFVRMSIRPPNLKYSQELRQAYQEARTQQRGFLSN